MSSVGISLFDLVGLRRRMWCLCFLEMPHLVGEA